MTSGHAVREVKAPARAAKWPPSQWPAVDVNPDNDLAQPVDWMTYPHEALYIMATTRIDVAGAADVSREWASVAKELEDLSADLESVVKTTNEGWHGDSAELARETSRRMSGWADDVSSRARAMSECYSEHASNATWARDNMPEPVDGPPNLAHGEPVWRSDGNSAHDLWTPWHFGHNASGAGSAGPIAAGGHGSAAGSSFTGGFDSAHGLIAHDGAADDERQRRHARAAEVMRHFQESSATLHHKVPTFDPPEKHGVRQPHVSEAMLHEKSTGPIQAHAHAHADEHLTDRTTGSTTAASFSGATELTPPAATLGTSAAAAPGALSSEVPASGGFGGAGSISSALDGSEAPGIRAGGAGALGSGQTGSVGSAAAGARGAGGGMGMAGAGMGMGRGAGSRDDDKDHHEPDYMEEDSDLFRPDEKVYPSLIAAPEERERMRDA